MFAWYWVFLYILIHVHLVNVSHSILVHRGIAHKLFKVKKPLEYVFRFILWTDKRLGPLWAETYSARHRKHHATSDTEADPHSPHHIPWNELSKSWYVSPDDIIKYCPDVTTPNDWMQRTLHEKYHKLGPVVVCLLAGILYGVSGLIITAIWLYLTYRYAVFVYLGNVATHKFGYGQTVGSDKSTNFFPIGIIFAGEELHNNHHNYPGHANLRQKWFEFDIGYVYAKIFEKMKLLEIVKVEKRKINE